jgi:hypothetical protein
MFYMLWTIRARDGSFITQSSPTAWATQEKEKLRELMVGDLNLRHSLDDPHQRVEISESHNKTIHEVK